MINLLLDERHEARFLWALLENAEKELRTGASRWPDNLIMDALKNIRERLQEAMLDYGNQAEIMRQQQNLTGVRGCDE